MERSVDSASPGRARGAECRATARQNEDVIKFIILSPYIILETTSIYCYCYCKMYECASVWVLVVWNKEEMECSAAVKGNGVHGTFVRRLEQMATRLCFENRCVIRKRLQLHEFKFDDCSNEIGVFSLLTNGYCLVANGGSENFYRCVLSGGD